MVTMLWKLLEDLVLTIKGNAERIYPVKTVSRVWKVWQALYKSFKYLLGVVIETRDAKMAKYNAMLYEERILHEKQKIAEVRYKAKRKFY